MKKSKSEKIAEKLEALRAELKEAKSAETAAIRKQARSSFTKAARRAGLMRLVVAGAVTPEALEQEFRAVALRLKAGAAATASGKDKPTTAAAEPVPTSGGKDESQERKPFWNR